MKKGQFSFCGEDLSFNNSHWLRSYGQFLIFLADLDMSETLGLKDYPHDENTSDYSQYTEGLQKVMALFESEGFHVEGYTLRTLSDWFIDFCNKWHSMNQDIQIQARKDKIESLKEELRQLGEPI